MFACLEDPESRQGSAPRCKCKGRQVTPKGGLHIKQDLPAFPFPPHAAVEGQNQWALKALVLQPHIHANGQCHLRSIASGNSCCSGPRDVRSPLEQPRCRGQGRGQRSRDHSQPKPGAYSFPRIWSGQPEWTGVEPLGFILRLLIVKILYPPPSLSGQSMLQTKNRTPKG